MNTQQSAASYIENPPSYTDRLIDYVQSSGVSPDIVSASVALIKSFRQQVAEEYKNRQPEKKVETDPNKINYGKYNGRTVQEVVVFDKPYLLWLTRQTFMLKNPEHLAVIKSAIE
jgi:uncharacterized protein (DUF3820 family)